MSSRTETWLGIDLGTSGVKVVLVDGEDHIVDQAAAPLAVSRPQPLWSEQAPADWLAALRAAMHELRSRSPEQVAAVRGIGLSGQMHGACLVDDAGRVLRDAILWNDGRCARECAALEAAVPNSREITGNLAMPGFTAPKLLWVRDHEPEVFAKLARVLLPKDWLRLQLTGEYASDMSDSAGTLWLDVAERDWSDDMLAACDLSRDAMPALFEGNQSTGQLRDEFASEWGMGNVPVAAGAGDNAAGAVGVGVVQPGQAFLSLGTSGVSFVCDEAFRPNPAGAVHAFCHCLPDTWHQMSVILSAASCLSWVTKLVGAADEASLLAEVAQRGAKSASVQFLPYLSGERTPHNDPHAQGVFFGMTHSTDRVELAQAVLEGVAFAFADGQRALLDAGTKIESYDLIGGGARSELWASILASVLDRPMVLREGGDVGPANGAARLARMAVTGESPRDVCIALPVRTIVEPDAVRRDLYAARLDHYRTLYAALQPHFPRDDA